MGQKARSGKATLDRTGWRGCFHDAVTTAASELRPHVANDLEAIGDVLQLLGDIFAELAQMTAAIRTAVGVRKMRDNFTGERFGKWLAPRACLRFLNWSVPLNSCFHLGLRALQLFHMEFELFKLKNDLLALDAEHHVPQLLDDQLEMFDLLAA